MCAVFIIGICLGNGLSIYTTTLSIWDYIYLVTMLVCKISRLMYDASNDTDDKLWAVYLMTSYDEQYITHLPDNLLDLHRLGPYGFLSS